MYESGAQKSCIQKTMQYSQFTKCQSNKNWEKFRKQRNFVTKLKRKSMKTYFLERCSGGTKSGDCWKTIKPFFSKKGSSGEQKIVLNDSDKIVNDQKEDKISLLSEFFPIFVALTFCKLRI
jgi:hypothetical protein